MGMNLATKEKLVNCSGSRAAVEKHGSVSAIPKHCPPQLSSGPLGRQFIGAVALTERKASLKNKFVSFIMIDADIEDQYNFERVRNLKHSLRPNQSLKLTAQKGVQSRHKRINCLIYSGSHAAVVKHSSGSTHPEHFFAAA